MSKKDPKTIVKNLKDIAHLSFEPHIKDKLKTSKMSLKDFEVGDIISVKLKPDNVDQTFVHVGFFAIFDGERLHICNKKHLYPVNLSVSSYSFSLTDIEEVNFIYSLPYPTKELT